jgi:hypothetical protein
MNVNMAKPWQRSQHFDACDLSTINNSESFQLPHTRKPLNVFKARTSLDPQKAEGSKARETAEIPQFSLIQ